MFRPRSTKRDIFWPARPKRLDLGQVWLSEVCFVGTTRNFYVSTKFDQARYVSTGATKTCMFRPSSTKRDTFRTAPPKHLCFDQVRPSLTNRDMFRPAPPKHLIFNQVRPSEICFDRHDNKFLCFDQVRSCEIRFNPRDRNIYVSTKFDQASYVSIGTTTKFDVLTKIDQAICFDRRDQNI